MIMPFRTLLLWECGTQLRESHTMAVRTLMFRQFVKAALTRENSPGEFSTDMVGERQSGLRIIQAATKLLEQLQHTSMFLGITHNNIIATT